MTLFSLARYARRADTEAVSITRSAAVVLVASVVAGLVACKGPAETPLVALQKRPVGVIGKRGARDGEGWKQSPAHKLIHRPEGDG